MQNRQLSNNIYPPATRTRAVLPRSRAELADVYPMLRAHIHKRLHPEEAGAQSALVETHEDVHRLNWDVEPKGIGICLSGGGIRSASFSLGALQAMEEEGMLVGSSPDRAKYLSAVSGGSYIATAVTLVTRGPIAATRPFGDASVLPPLDPPGNEPDMRPFAPGTPEEQFLRNHTLYLTAGKGGAPGAIWKALLGALLNLVLVGWSIGLVAIPLGWLYGWRWPALRAPGGAWSVPQYMWESAAAAGVCSVLSGFVWIAWRFRKDWKHAFFAAASGALLVTGLLILVFGIAVPDIIHLARPPRPMGTATDTKTTVLSSSSAGLLAVLAAWIASARNAVKGVGASTAKEAEALASRYRSMVFKIAGFLGGPILLFLAVTMFGYLGAGYPPGGSGTQGTGELLGWGLGCVAFFLICRNADVNTWSLYPYYRRRLSSAFVLGRTRRLDGEPSTTAVDHADAQERPYVAKYRISDCQPDNFPQLLVCASANVSDRGATPAGSNVTSFVFSKDWVGGPLVGAVSSACWDKSLGPGAQARFATLPTAMAISGAAISPSMGKMTRPWLRLYMALANLRLGVWVPNPRRLDLFCPRRRVRKILARPDYILRELFGRNHMDAPFLYLTDGGHYENLGLVELLRRKCQMVWCVDASGDKIDTFGTLGGALATAESELGVSFTICPKQDMWPSEKPADDTKPCFVKSPYCRGTFTYADGTSGRIVVVKAGVPENAPWSIRAYQSAHPVFPCDSTIDQLFDADRFEAYRELGYFSVHEALKKVKPDGTDR